MNNVSVFKAPVKNTVPFRAVSLPDVAKVVKSTKYKNITDKLRGLASPDEKGMCKASEFDYTTFSGTFSKRANNSLIDHSNYLCTDIDHVGDHVAINLLKQQVSSIYEPALMFVSPSGDGLKIIFAIDTSKATHEQYFIALQAFFRKELHTEIDEKCKDVSRATFLCHDPDCFYTETPTVLGIDFISKYSPIMPAATIQKPPAASEAIIDTSVIIERLIVWLNKTQSFVTGNRNKYISELCGAFNRYGIDENTALDTLLQYAESGFPESSIRATVRSIYANTSLHNTAHFEAPTGQQKEPGEPEEVVTPLMPIDGFPDFIQHLINECTRIYGTHRDLWAAAFFAASSTAIGQSVMLKTQYENTALFWLAVVGASGVGKSEPFRFAFRQIHDMDYKAFEQHKKEARQYNIDKKAKGDTPPEPLPCKHNIIVDTTPEAMAKAMSGNPRGITIMRDELHGWFMDFGRYSKSGEQQNMLSTWSQQVFKVLRSNGDDLFINNPFVNVFGGIQPAVLPEMAKDNRAVNGFLPRFCFVFPDKIETPRFQREELPAEMTTYYHSYIERLLNISGNREEIRLSNEALNLYGDFVNKNAAINDSGKQADYLNEVNAKLNIIVLRTSIVFHFAEYACTGNSPSEVNQSTMKAAINLCEYFRVTAKKVYNILNQSTDRNNKKEVAKYLQMLGNSQNEIANVLKVSQQYISKINK